MPTSSAVEIVVDPASLDQSRHGGITGIVLLQTASWSFPDDRWSDFPVVVLAWWLEAVAGLLSGPAWTAQCRFMDGPFLFRVSPQDDAKWLLQCFTDSSGSPLHQAVIEPQAFVYSLRQAAASVLAACRTNDWRTSEIDVLTQHLSTPSGQRPGA